jgi:RNA polymerase sigma-70 factor (ECF subfamily)
MSIVRALNGIKNPLELELEEIFREHARLIYRTAYGVTGRSEDAEDILQNLFLGLIRKGCPPGLKENPKGYLYRSAINLSLNAVRSYRRDIAAVETIRRENPVEFDLRTLNINTSHELIDAVAQLPSSAVEMLILRYEFGYSGAEIGKLLGKSRGVIAVTLYRTRARLRKLLSGGKL